MSSKGVDRGIGIVYAAKSSDDVHGSIPRQLEDGRKIAVRDGLEIVAEYHDEAASAFSGNRGGGLADAKAHAEQLAAEGHDVRLIVQHSDRLARGDGRTAHHLVQVALWAAETGVAIESVQDPATFQGTGFAYAAMMGDRNHEDSRRKSEAVKSGKKGQLARGRSLGPVNDGYKLVPSADGLGRDWARDPERAPIIERIADSVEAGHTPGDIARRLNSEGIRTKRGRLWTTRQVRLIVTSPIYAGYVLRREDGTDKVAELHEGAHPPLIDRERWHRLQDLLQRMNPEAIARRNASIKYVAGTPDDPYILRGIGRCFCGEPLYIQQRAHRSKALMGTMERGYSCKQVRLGTGACKARWIPAELAERYVLEHLDKFIEDIPAWLTARLADRQAEAAQLEAAIGRAKAHAKAANRERDAIAEQWRRWTAAGDDRKADLVLVELERADDRLATAERDVDVAHSRLEEWTAPVNYDAALDFYNELVGLVRGELAGCSASGEIRAALRKMLHSVHLQRTDDDRLQAFFFVENDLHENELHFTEGALPPERGGWLPKPDVPRWLSSLDLEVQNAHTIPDSRHWSSVRFGVAIPPLDATMPRTVRERRD